MLSGPGLGVKLVSMLPVVSALAVVILPGLSLSSVLELGSPAVAVWAGVVAGVVVCVLLPGAAPELELSAMPGFVANMSRVPRTSSYCPI